ncbi:hypothetical protein Ahy_B09g097998 isoform B [Arachis hypogaea]|uniref:Uncharacterized protein n=3 Tax=Arachis hypogaea TaxID=3818 RepID=A0A444XQB2_ARAHY|nr:hypothetical protein Ahy_B09g097998 isoform B [Arachis hypogaea]
MWKVTQQQKYNIPFPSLITRLAALSGVERRPTDRTSVLISKQPFLPYGDYEGPPQMKRKTTEPSSSAEPSAPPAPPVPTPRLQTPYELGREILKTLHRFEHRNARCFQWIVAKFEGRDLGPPPSDTPEHKPETKEPAPEEPAAEAGQTVEPHEQTATKTTVEESTVQIAAESIVQIVEELASVAEPRAETAAEPAGQAFEEPTAGAEHRAEPTIQPSSAIIVYHHHHHPPPPDNGASQS